MAIAIRSIPVLINKAASVFNTSVEANITKKASVNFSKQVAASAKILAKAKI